MNAKKSKHKKSKPPNTCETPVFSENIENLKQVKSDEFVSDDKERCFENKIIMSIRNEGVCQEDAPVKPKRKKGKKKKQEVVADSITATESLDNESNHNISLESKKISEVHSDTEKELAPSGKKKKGKKKIDKAAEKLIEDTKIIAPVVSNEVVSDNICSDIPNSAPKKKQKEKKQSEHTTDFCISAFQKLLQHGDSHEESYLSNNIYTEDVQNNTENKQSLDTVVTNKKKKKNKKDKKSSVALMTSDILIETKKEVLKNNEDVKSKTVALTEENQIEASEERHNIVNKDTSPKPKVKFAKPLGKKRKDKKLQNTPEIDTEEKILVEENNKDIIIPIDSNTELSKLNANLESNIDVTSSTFDEHLQKQEEENIGLDESSKEKQQSSITSYEKIQNNESKFTEIRPSRKKRRAEKNTDTFTISENDAKSTDNIKNTNITLNIQSCEMQSNSTEEESNIMPDFIHYPRSSSQQQFDNNNNMIIQELNSPDDDQLGIPILMSVPVIEGSGESPEVRSKIDPLDVEVIEIKSELINESVNNAMTYEKKDDEVMEDLKISIEKSLPESTELEKSEIETEKEFVEVLEYNLRNSVTVQGEKLLYDQNLFVPNLKAEDKIEKKNVEEKFSDSCSSPVCPVRKNKKGKSKKKDKISSAQSTITSSSVNPTQSETNQISKETNKNENKDKNTYNDKKPDNNNTGKQQSTHESILEQSSQDFIPLEAVYEPIDNFEDALTSSTEDVNFTFEMIAKEATGSSQQKPFQKPEISITEPDAYKKKIAKKNSVSQPKNLLGHPRIPVQSNNKDYKKEKNKPPNTMSAKVKVKDANEIEKLGSKDLQKNKLLKQNSSKESYTYKTNENDDFVYKYSFRKVYLPNVCQVCMKELGPRVACKFCNLLFYCSQKHKDEDWAQHQFLCFVVCTKAHLKEQKFIYGDAKNITGQEYRILRMQMIISCEKMLKRKLVPWEQEALLYPRICTESSCREWRQGFLSDCKGCGQVAYCTEHSEHLPVSHQRWCKSYALYQKLVSYQQKLGRLEPKLPTKVMSGDYHIPETMNDVLTSLYDEKLDMSDIEYASLSQVATAPLTSAYSHQASIKDAKGFAKKAVFTIHIVGAELQFEADVLNKWEIFFLHLRPDVKDLRVVLISLDLNPSNLPLDLLSRVKLCEKCRASGRRLGFSFIDKKTYQDYFNCEDFLKPDIVCAFNQSIDRASNYNGKDHWPTTINCVSKLKTPLVITAYTFNELSKDLSRVKKLFKFDEIIEPKYNNFASVRPDRNFITDDEMPLLFKNYCYTVVCG